MLWFMCVLFVWCPLQSFPCPPSSLPAENHQDFVLRPHTHGMQGVLCVVHAAFFYLRSEWSWSCWRLAKQRGKQHRFLRPPLLQHCVEVESSTAIPFVRLLPSTQWMAKALVASSEAPRGRQLPSPAIRVASLFELARGAAGFACMADGGCLRILSMERSA